MSNCLSEPNFQYPTGPSECGSANCPIISNFATNPGIIFQLCFWGVSALIFIFYSFSRYHESEKMKLKSKSQQKSWRLVSRQISDYASQSSALKNLDVKESGEIEMIPPKLLEKSNSFSVISFSAEEMNEKRLNSISKSISFKKYDLNETDVVNNDLLKQAGLNELEAGDLNDKNAHTSFDIKIDKNSTIQAPHKRNYLGFLSSYLMGLISINLLIWYIILCIDYYNDCQINGVNNTCFYGDYFITGSYYLNAKLFFAWWWMSFTWFGLILVFYHQLSVWFMSPCSMEEATHMYVWVRDDFEIIANEVINPFVQTLRTLTERIIPTHLLNGHESLVPVERAPITNTPFFVHECTRYIYDVRLDSYLPASVDDLPVTHDKFHKISKSGGLPEATVRRRQEVYGDNKIIFRTQTVTELLVSEYFTVLYFYQFSMYSIWIWWSYIFVGALQFAIVLIGGFIAMYIQHTNEKTIASLTQHETQCTVRRDGSEVNISSHKLVPGDIIVLTGYNNWVIPADMIILAGDCIMNESGLTGESMPVQKVACLHDDMSFDPQQTDSKHMLLAGTTTLQVSTSCEAMVTATATNTCKGQLISNILFPKKGLFRYEEELSAVTVIMLIIGLVSFTLNVIFTCENGTESFWVTTWAASMFTITQVFSPLIPIALKVGQVRSTARLLDKQIFCISPRHIPICGKINIFGFDKTGTLTKEGLEFYACCYVQEHIHTSTAGSTVEDVSAPCLKHAGDDMKLLSSECASMIDGMATCHSLAKLGLDEYVGNQVEVDMFKAVNYKMEGNIVYSCAPNNNSNNTPSNKYLKIIRKFDFDHGKQMMSVIVTKGSTSINNENKSHEAFVFTKGSFEKIGELCDRDTLPKTYYQEARDFAIQGGYVIAMAMKQYQFPNNLPTDSEEEYLSKLKRNDIEKPGGFKLLGLLIFRNEPKSDSKAAITELRAGRVRPVMITGDNAFCGQYIARRINMIDMPIRVLLAEKGDGQVIQWRFIGENDSVVYTTDMVLTLKNTNTGGCYIGNERIELAITGNDCLQDLYKDPINMSKQFLELQTEIRIFARMSPEHKTWLVEKFRQSGHIVGMCGDGGNDCGALRAAHAGIALSDAEASAVSPFTSKTKAPTSAVDIVKEGRAALATSFANYKFLITYGFCFVIVKLTGNWYGTNISNFCYLFLDAIVSTTVSYAMTLCKPLNTLSDIRPTSSLLGPITMTSEIGSIIFYVMSFLSSLALISNDPDYVRWPARYANGLAWWYNSDSWEATIFFGSFMSYILFTSFWFSLGYKFRQPVWRNYYLMSLSGSFLIILWYVFLSCPNYFNQLFHIASMQYNIENGPNPIWQAYQNAGNPPSPGMSFSLRLKLMCMWLGFALMNMIWQALVVNGYFGDLVRAKYPNLKRAPYLC